MCENPVDSDLTVPCNFFFLGMIASMFSFLNIQHLFEMF